jgi:hypothetical protein
MKFRIYNELDYEEYWHLITGMYQYQNLVLCLKIDLKNLVAEKLLQKKEKTEKSKLIPKNYSFFFL